MKRSVAIVIVLSFIILVAGLLAFSYFSLEEPPINDESEESNERIIIGNVTGESTPIATAGGSGSADSE